MKACTNIPNAINSRRAVACSSARVSLVLDAAVVLVVSICVVLLRIMMQFYVTGP